MKPCVAMSTFTQVQYLSRIFMCLYLTVVLLFYATLHFYSTTFIEQL